MNIYSPTISGSLTISGSIITTGGGLPLTGSLVSSGSFTSIGPTIVSGSLTVATGSGIEFQVLDAGVKIGNLASDNHTITGSLLVSGSSHTITGSLRVSGSNNSIFGKVAIGTGSAFPESTFDVVGTNVLRENALSAHSWFPYTDGNVYVSCRTGSAIIFRQFHETSATTFMTITGSKVGIGVTNPSRTLQVKSNSEGITAGISGATYGIRFDNGGANSPNMSTIHGTDHTLVGSYQSIMLNGLDVRFGTSDTERMRINSSGTITKPYQPGFQVTRGNSSTQALSGDSTILQFNTVVFDNQSNFNTSTYRFTAPVAGVYLFTCQARYDNSYTVNSYLRTHFNINGQNGTGAGYNYGHQIMGSYTGYSVAYESGTISAILKLAAGDYVDVRGGVSGGATEFQRESQFSGYLLG
jgi:hypothetical protein